MTADDLDRLWEVAERAAAAGARVVADAATRARDPARSKGAVGDYVTDADLASERAIRTVLERATPDIAVIAEESGGHAAERFWAVDPLDATTNFLIGFPIVAVSVALVEPPHPILGVVEAPLLGERFSGARGRGAWRGAERLAVSVRPPARAIVAMAFPFRARERMDRYEPVLRRVFDGTEDVRRAGSAALDLAWTAAGVFDGYLELNLGVWDLAAGALLVREAGGVVTDWDGGDEYLGGDVLAGSPQTWDVLADAAGRR